MNHQDRPDNLSADVPVTRQAWEAPVLEEIDYHDTASGPTYPIGFDGAGYSANISVE